MEIFTEKLKCADMITKPGNTKAYKKCWINASSPPLYIVHKMPACEPAASVFSGELY